MESNLFRKLSTGLNSFATKLNQASHTQLLTILLLSYGVIRLLSLNFVERSGDAIYKWGILRYNMATGVWYPEFPNHHQGRWAIMMPELCLSQIFGADSIWGYYTFPVLCGAAAACLSYWIVSHFRSKAAGCVAFFLTFFLPQALRESTQFLPMLPAAVFVLAAFWTMLRYLERRKLIWILATGVLLILSYGCKFTSLYWAGAFGLYLWYQERFKITTAVLLLGATMAVGLGIETWVLNSVFDVTMGRVSIILGAHLKDRVEPQYLNLWEYLLSFYRPIDLSGKYMNSFPKTILMGIALLISIQFLRQPKLDTGKRLLAWSFLCVWFCHSYVVYKFFPFLHPERANSRYFLVLYIVAGILCCIGFSDFTALCGKLRGRFSSVGRVLPGVLVFAVMLLMTIAFFNTMQKEGSLVSVIRSDTTIRQALSEAIPVLLELEEPLAPGQMPDNADLRNYTLWATLYLPIETIPTLANRLSQPPDPSLIWHDPATGEQFWVMANGENLTPTAQKRLILKRNRFKEVTFTLAKAF